jgi:hypothetical protein
VVRFRRRGRRHHYRRNPVFDPMGAIKDLVSVDTLTLAGGAVLGGLVTSWLMSKYGPYMVNAAGTGLVPNTGAKLPGVLNADNTPNKTVILAYGVGIPAAASMLTHQFSPKLSRGLMIGAATILVQNVISMVQGASGTTVVSNGGTKGPGAYLTRGTIRALPGSPPGYSAVRAFGGALDNSNAFRGAWSR